MKRQNFCNDWMFAKEGEALMQVCLPHDAMQTEKRIPGAPSGSGCAWYQGGKYTYEKTFDTPEDWRDKTVYLEFEGVYPTARVSLNDLEIGSEAYGYNLFRVELKGLRYGEKNILRVEADNSQTPNSRWYSGAGIYRPVWLLVGNRRHIEPDGIRVTTLSYDPARIRIDIRTSADADNDEIVTEILYKGETVAEAAGNCAVIDIPDAHLWNDEHPDLYKCCVRLFHEGNLVDESEIQFGIRILEWSKKGFFVNGKSVLLKGGCIHHDNGILGARSYDVSEWRRIKKLKDFGFNAIRSSHNPACRAMLEACDALGVYVMDELWDMWDKSKTEFDYSNRFTGHYEADIEGIAAKDYNHPSVIMYSIGNEVTEPARPEGVELAGKLYAKLKEADPTRPVTAGINLTLLLLASMEHNPLEGGGGDAIPDTSEMNSTVYNQMVSEMGNRMTMAAATPMADQVSAPVLDLLDIAGYNYAVSRYAAEGEMHPDRLVVGTETYCYDLAKTWPMVEKYPYVIGDFMWTAWDYLGEAGVGGWSYDPEDMGFGKSYPWLLGDTGALDILGNDNAEAGLAAVVWGKKTTPYIGVCPANHPGVVAAKAIWRGSNALPYWSYAGCDGNETDVEVYTTGAEVELFMNGRLVGREQVTDAKAIFHVKYESGEVKAVAYDIDGNYLSESSLCSADDHTQIRICPETAAAQPGEVVYLDIDLTGENGEIECNKDRELTIDVTGAELLAFGSANPKTEETFLTDTHSTYYGRAQAVIKVTNADAAVTVSGEGLEKAVVSLKGGRI